MIRGVVVLVASLFMSSVPTVTGFCAASPMRLDAFVNQECEPNLAACILAIASSSVRIGDLIARAPIDGLLGGAAVSTENSSGDKVKKLDVVSSEILKASLLDLGGLSLIVSEEEVDPIITNHATLGGKLIVAFDPLDGSSNIDCAVATGTIVGIYRQPSAGAALGALTLDIAREQVRQRGTDLVAALYVMYSSSTEMMLCTGFGKGTHGFSLDPSTKSFVQTREFVQIPARGQYYSLNEGRSADWPEGLRSYIDAVKNGRGVSAKRYSSRYICSLVADFHRTMLYGGWAGNPRSHLRLLYEAAPLAMLSAEAGGDGTDGQQRLLNIRPSTLHQKTPVFLGSRDDIEELLSYGDIQQQGTIKYEA
jgi:fructose-1,6-bisphosphatase I